MIIVSIRYVHNHTEPVANPEISKGDTPRNGDFRNNNNKKKELGHFGLQFLSFTHMKNFWQKGVSKSAIVNINVLCMVFRLT
jgi:hypothetical protein